MGEEKFLYNLKEYYFKIPNKFKPFIVYNHKYFYVVTYAMTNKIYYFFSVNAFPTGRRLFHFDRYTMTARDMFKTKTEIGAYTGTYLQSKYKNSSFIFVETVSDMKTLPHLQDLEAKRDFFENVFYDPSISITFFRDGYTLFPNLNHYKVLRFPCVNFHIDKLDVWEKQFKPNLDNPEKKQMYGTITVPVNLPKY